MASLTPSPKQQFVDANGVPLSGGKVYSYAAGTTTPLVTYTNESGTIPNTNPVILDSRGEASIWLGVASYKLKLTTATDVEIWTVDNIISSSVQALADLSESGGSALVGFLQSGAGAVATTVQAKLRETVSVKDFGAVGDGVADDTAAIQNAFSYGGPLYKTIYFPAGKYKTTSALTFSGAGGIWMEGAGGGGTDAAIYPSGSGYTALTINGGVNVLNVTLYGGANTINGLYLNGFVLSTANKIRINNFNGFGLRIDKCFDSLIENVSIELCGNNNTTTLNTFAYKNYAFGMFDAGDTCNMTHILRLQVEQANTSAIYISPNTLSCVIDNIHSERATPTAGVDTWVFGGNRCTYNNSRIQSIGTVANSKCLVVGNNNCYINFLSEGLVPVSWDGSSGANLTMVAPEVNGTLSEASGQFGTLTLVGGSVVSFSGNLTGYRRFGQKGIGPVSFTPALQFGGASVGISGSITGKYQIVGGSVEGWIDIGLTSKGSSTGAASISIPGLPPSVNSLPASSFFMQTSNITYTGQPFGFLAQNSNSVVLFQNQSAATPAALTDANFTNTSGLRMFFSYSYV
jgi:hypothetical protein